MNNNYSARVTRLGIPDQFIYHGEQKELYDECHFDANAIKDAVRQAIGEAVLV